MKSCALALMTITTLFFLACGGGTTTPSQTYTISGMVTGLMSTGLVLENNGSDNLPINANGAFSFTTAVTSGSPYQVTVLTPPLAQTCSVTAGSGTATSNITNVQVACTLVSAPNEWTWMGGSTATGSLGTYGTLGTPDPSNIPGARSGAIGWADPSGDFWLFGGIASNGLFPLLNDLWKYSAGQWTWEGGSSVNGYSAPGTYGTQGTPAPDNFPGARYYSSSSTDAAGNLWLFGGTGFGTDTTNASFLNDLWKYSGGQWTWVSGSSDILAVGIYGTQGVADPTNVPGARQSAVSWTDSSGNFWLFGGTVCCDPGYYVNDLWKYSNGEWTWMRGSNQSRQSGTYGTQGVGAPGNSPGAREGSASWTDAAGNFWLLGGYGYDSVGTIGYLDDMWEYTAGQWTWMSGYNFANAYLPSTPVPRYGAVSWIDHAGNFWLSGGYAAVADGTVPGLVSDVWEYSAGQWTGSTDFHLQFGTYGTLGVPDPSNFPGARDYGVGWTDTAGNLWLFSGFGFASLGNETLDNLNDLWVYQPLTILSSKRSNAPRRTFRRMPHSLP